MNNKIEIVIVVAQSVFRSDVRSQFQAYGPATENAVELTTCMGSRTVHCLCSTSKCRVLRNLSSTA